VTVLRRFVAVLVLLAVCLSGHLFDASVAAASDIAPTPPARYTYDAIAKHSPARAGPTQHLAIGTSSIHERSGSSGDLGSAGFDFVAAETAGSALPGVRQGLGATRG
jgi:hypothetical protein